MQIYFHRPFKTCLCSSNFRFHREIPAVEVHLNVKTQVNASVREVELLAMMDEAIRNKLNGVNSHAVIDPDSLRVENKSLREYWESQARQHSPNSLIKTRQFA